MKMSCKLTAVIAVILLSLSLFSTIAYAAPAEETLAVENAMPDSETIQLPPGTGTVVDVFADEDGRKFYTIQTPAGNTFYLIIDFNEASENVYFLDAVNEKDLLALAEKENITGGESVTAESNISHNTNLDSPNNQADSNDEPKNNTQNLIMFGVVLAVLIVGGVVFFIKSRKSKKSNDSSAEYEADEQDEYFPDDCEKESEDDLPPWQEE